MQASAPSRGEQPATIAFGDILTGLSHALDITEGYERGHAARACLIAMKMADVLGLPVADRIDLFYAILLKDAGGSSNATREYQLFGARGDSRASVGLHEWRSLTRESGYSLEHGQAEGSIWDRIAQLGHLAKAGREGRRTLFRIRSGRGARMALGLGLSEGTAAAIRAMDEHWDGGGDPIGLAGRSIPLLGRIICLAQVAEVFSQSHDRFIALEIIERRRGRWFDPELVDLFRFLTQDDHFWAELRGENVDALVAAAEPARYAIVADEWRLDQIADAFAALIDAKSPFTSDHSRRVAHLSAKIAERLGFPAADIRRLRRAALLHDIGKLGVPTEILEKPAKLTPDEWAVVRTHPAHTLQILHAVPGFRDFAFDAACHHEKLDGSGYHCGYTARELSPTARALTVADMADALLAERPYRPALDPLDALRILHGDAIAGQLCADSVGALTDYLTDTISGAGERTRSDEAPSLLYEPCDLAPVTRLIERRRSNTAG